MNLWNPIDGLENVVLDPESAGADVHSKKAIEVELPCWTGKVDFRIRYLDGSNEKWKNCEGVSVNFGDTVQINIP